jgi:hypothetical protein
MMTNETVIDALDTEMVERTFAELGIKGFRPLQKRLLLRTHPIAQMTGGVYLPQQLTSFYGEMPHMQPIIATVIAAGPKCSLVPGEKIAFLRLHFARWQRMEDGTFVGWITDEENIVGRADLHGAESGDMRIESVSSRRLY